MARKGPGREAEVGKAGSSPLRQHEQVREGLPYEVLEDTMDSYGLVREEACRALDLSPRTFNRRRHEGRLRPDESDRLYRLARLAALASEALGSSRKAAAWLHRENRALGGYTPLELVRSDAGAREVEAVLKRMQYGVFS